MKIPGHFYGTFETGGYRTSMGNSINADFENVIQLGTDSYGYSGATGRPRLWVPDAKSSSTSTLVVKGRSYPNGAVHLTGCFRDRRVFVYKFMVAPGSATPTPIPTPVTGTYPIQVTPVRITVVYQPAKRVWLITAETALPNSLIATLCPADQ